MSVVLQQSFLGETARSLIVGLSPLHSPEHLHKMYQREVHSSAWGAERNSSGSSGPEKHLLYNPLWLGVNRRRGGPLQGVL